MPDLGSGGKPCRFKSCQAHQTSQNFAPRRSSVLRLCGKRGAKVLLHVGLYGKCEALILLREVRAENARLW